MTDILIINYGTTYPKGAQTVTISTSEQSYDCYGAMMGDGFLDALLAPVPLKPFVENKSRLTDGKKVVIPTLQTGQRHKVDSRTFNLTFNIHGDGETLSDMRSSFATRKNRFYEALYKGMIDISFDDSAGLTSDHFHLKYDGNSVQYAQSLDRTSCKITVKFEETNPANRI